MPTANEKIANRALSGAELKSLLFADFTRLCENEWALQPHLGYGRVGYEIILRLHMDNPMQPKSESFVRSRRQGTAQIEADAGLAAVEPAPLATPLPSPDADVIGVTLRRDITSPNAERVRAGIPVPVITKNADGSTTQREVTYPKPDASEGDGEVRVTDTEREARTAWGLLNEPQAVVITEPKYGDDALPGKQYTTDTVTTNYPMPELTPEQIAQQTERINAIAAEKIRQENAARAAEGLEPIS